MVRGTHRWMAAVAVLVLGAFATTGAHCDTMDGPVVRSAKAALEGGDVAPALHWVRAEDESAIRAAFVRAHAVRTKDAEARELADMYFFETLVRIHRAGEGEPYTGLKPAGTEIEPGIRAADAALESGSADALVGQMTEHVAEGIRARYAEMMERRRHADESVAAGRAFVAAYVAYMHHVEGIHAAAVGSAHSHGEAMGAATPGEHDAHAAERSGHGAHGQE